MLQAVVVDNVYDLWSREGERLLVQLAQRQGHHVEKGSSRRGHPVFQEQRRHPPVLHEQASTLQSRRVWKAICRAREVAVARPGFRRDKTWGYFARLLDSLGRDVREELEPLLRQTVDRSIAIRATELLEVALRRAQVQRLLHAFSAGSARYVLLLVPLTTGCVTKLSLRPSNSPPPLLLAPLPRRKLAWRPSKQFGKAFIASSW